MSIAQSGPETIKKGDGAKHAMRIDYCGGWGYRPKAVEAIAKIEEQMPGHFVYYLMRDNGATGRLEVTIFPNTTEMGETGAGEFIHSKATSKQYIAVNYRAFLDNVKTVLGLWELWVTEFDSTVFLSLDG